MATDTPIRTLRVLLFGANSDEIRSECEKHERLVLVEDGPDVVVCYGGDGTLLTSERRWPGVPKVPIRNSRTGHRMISHPPEQVLERLAQDLLVPTTFTKIRCSYRSKDRREIDDLLSALNEFNIQGGRTNSAVRYRLWIDDEPFEHGAEMLGDGFVVSTPFGSTAYYRQITRGIFYTGLGIAFKFTSELVNHVVLPEDVRIRAVITRGPAILACDNAPESLMLTDGDELIIERDPVSATVLAWEPLRRPAEEL